METKRDTWAKVEIISKIVGAILIPLALFYFGNQYNAEREQSNAEQRDFQNAMELLGLCHNENENLRLAGFDFAVYLRKKGMLDPNLEPILSQAQSEEPNAENAKKTGERMEMLKTAPATAQRINALDSKLASRVYIHINRPDQRDKAERIKILIEENSSKFEKGMIVPGIELKKYASRASQLRVFNKDDMTTAQRFQRVLQSMGVTLEVVDLSAKYANSRTRPGHFEIWFGNDF